MTRTPSAAIYDDDFFAWTQEQATALRAVPREIAGDVDVAHVAEEIEDLGRRDLREVTAFLRRWIEHLIKINACPDARDIPHWRAEARHFHQSALDAYSPSMRRLLDAAAIWDGGRSYALGYLNDVGIAWTGPSISPFSLDELLSSSFDLDMALARLAASTLRRRPADP